MIRKGSNLGWGLFLLRPLIGSSFDIPDRTLSNQEPPARGPHLEGSTMSVAITPIYAALTAFIFLALSWRVISYRRANLISLGDKGDKNLLKRMRAQANCAEYAPFAVLILLLVELSGAPALATHLLGISLVAGRALHAYGFASTPQKIILRQLGMLLTLLVIALGAIGVLAHALV
ncbi:MAPEG family protein [Sulfitobacter geojensis]|uniref:MAPEG family protein n=1 Tax=Sulfitobacter geojensis TaxID=1342299 RepID=UPI003BAB50FC